MADITTDLSNSGTSRATLSEPVDPASGTITGPYGDAIRAWGGLSAPPSDIKDFGAFTTNIAQLSDSDLNAVAKALGAALSRNYDEVMYKAQIAVDREGAKRTNHFVPCGAGSAQQCTPNVPAPHN